MRIVAHLDMDAFYASIEERDTPRFRGLPVAVGADPQQGIGRGVVSTANYKAREYGIHSALPISQAWRLSEIARKQGKPSVIFLSVDMKKYIDVSRRVLSIVRRFVTVVEEASIDEAYLELSFTESWEKAEEVCREIKRAIFEEEHLTASVGIGPNKLMAKIASSEQKPDGLTIVRAEQVEQFLEPLLIRKIPGIGPKTEETFHREGIRLVKDLKRFSPHELVERLGKRGLDLYDNIRGLDQEPVVEEQEAKSISEEETFDHDTRDSALICHTLKNMCQDVIRRMQDEGVVQFRTVGIKVRFGDFETKMRAHTLPGPAGSADALQFQALKLLMPFLDSRENPQRKLIRLVGVKIEKLASRRNISSSEQT